MLRIGLTGGIGCGKSTVLAALAARGAACIDTDQLARDVVAPGSEGLAAVVERFGAEVLRADGTLDRDRLGALVFSDPDARRDLEGLTHPRIAAAMAARIGELEAAGAPVVVIEIPLLFESGMDAAFDATVVVRADARVVRERLRARNGWSDAEIEARVASQMPVDEKARRATHVLDNSGERAALDRQLDALWRSWTDGAPGEAAQEGSSPGGGSGSE